MGIVQRLAAPLPQNLPTVRERIRHARTVAGLSQAELAELIGKPKAMVGRWEIADRNPGVESLQSLSKALGVSLQWLATGKDPLPKKRSADHASHALDEDLLLASYQAVESIYRERGIKASTATLLRLAASVYAEAIRRGIASTGPKSFAQHLRQLAIEKVPA